MKKLATCGLFLLLCASVASAQTVETVDASAAGEEQDFLEVGLGAGFGLPVGGIKDFRDSLGAKSGWDLTGHVGFFLSPDWVFGLQVNYYQFGVDIDDEDFSQNHRLYSPSLYLKRYVFGESDLVPYGRVNLGVDFPKFSTHLTQSNPPRFRELSYDPAISIGAGVGAFYYTSDYSGFFVEASFHHAFTKNSTKEFDGIEYEFGEATTVMDISAGINVFFGGD